jgi:hypothetical protein
LNLELFKATWERFNNPEAEANPEQNRLKLTCLPASENPAANPDLSFPGFRTRQKTEKKLDSRGDW